MISIIVSSYKSDLFLKFQKNVAETIGSEYEIIKINNPGLMGICQAYNIGISKAKYDFLCFAHEDILFHTNNWGKILIDTFESDKNLGLVGIAGSSYKSFLLSGWGPPQQTRFIKANILQVINGHPCLFRDKHNDGNPNAVVVDGCWLASTKEVIDKVKFDENIFKSYHCYDIDLSLNIGQNYKIEVLHSILVEHLSSGSFDQNWMSEVVKLHKKWNDLPRKSEPISKKEILNQEYLSLYEWLRRMKKNKSYGSLFYLLSLLLSSKFIKVLGLKNWLYFPFYTLGNLIKSLKYR